MKPINKWEMRQRLMKLWKAAASSLSISAVAESCTLQHDFQTLSQWWHILQLGKRSFAAVENTSRHICIHTTNLILLLDMCPRPTVNVVWDIRSQYIFKTHLTSFTPVPSAVHLWSDHPELSGLNRAKMAWQRYKCLCEPFGPLMSLISTTVSSMGLLLRT